MWCDVPAAASNAKPAPRVSRGAGALSLAVYREEAQHSSLLLRACRAVSRSMLSDYIDTRVLHQRNASPLRRAPVVRGASWDLQRQASVACLAWRRRLQSQPLERRRSTQACCARAPFSAVCGRLMPYTMTLSWREASFLRRAPVVQRASCDLQRQASVACLAWRRRAYAHCL